MKNKVWTTKDGQKILIEEMTDQHLLNTIAFLERVHQEEIAAAWSCLSTLRGEMAQFYCENDIDKLESEESNHPQYDDLVEEAMSRGLIK